MLRKIYFIVITGLLLVTTIGAFSPVWGVIALFVKTVYLFGTTDQTFGEAIKSGVAFWVLCWTWFIPFGCAWWVFNAVDDKIRARMKWGKP